MKTTANELLSKGFVVHNEQKFFDAIKNNEIDVISYFLDIGINVNLSDNKGNTALISAIYYGHEDIVKMFLNAPSIDINLSDKRGNTALIWAIHLYHQYIVEMLLRSKDIDINLPDNDGKTALIWATYYGYEKIIKMLSHK